MLHKSFKPAKCKTSLKLAVSRIKLLKNKGDSQVKHLKRELAQLLESGQEQTARIRVEHVVREEKTMEAYDLVEIYCELIVARLSIIESQKNCPIDLKEAISSIIFASPRCADIPELMDVRKHFTAKYGKEFVSAAVELRPDCGVSRLLVEKLSTKAPDGPTKIKILSAIAGEHNVNWDPKSFGEKEMMPPQDLLNRPYTFEQSSKMHVDPPNVQKPLNSVDKGHPNFRAPSEHYEKHDAPVNSHGSISRLPSHFQNVPSTAKAMPSDTAHPDLRPLGTESEEMEFRHSYPAERTGYNAGSQSWNMEFKDATAAAQAAAESAERASMAARAAAKLSSQGRISRQHSAESKKASVSESRDEGLHNYASSRLQGAQLAKDPVNNTSRRNNSGMNPEQSFESEQDDLAGLAERFYNLKSSNKSSHLASSKSSDISVDDYPQVSDFRMADWHSRKTSSEFEESDLLGEENIRRESSESEKEFASEVNDGMKSDHVGYFQEASIRKQYSSVSSHSHSQIPNDDHNAVSDCSREKFIEDAVKEPSIFYDGKYQSTTKETNSFENAAAVFDDSASDDDEFKFDEKGKRNDLDSSLYYSSEGRKSSSLLSPNMSSKSPRLNVEETLGKYNSQSPFASDWHSSSVFSEHLVSDTVPSRADDLLPVTFDDSDGQSSESEEELDKPKLVGSTRTDTFPHKDMAYFGNSKSTENESPHTIRSLHAVKENVESNRKTLILPSALDSDVEEHSERNQAIEVAETDKKFSYGYLHDKQTSQSHRRTRSQSNSSDKDDLQAPGSSPVTVNVQRYQSSDILEDTKPIKESSLETGNELNFGILTGGLRNKGYRHPPYCRNPSDNSSVAKQAEDNSTIIEQSSSSSKVDFSSGARDQEQYNQMLHPKVTKKPSLGTPAPYSDASEDKSNEELPKQTVSSSQEPNTRKAGTEVNKRSGLKSYFDSDNSELEEYLPKQTVTSKTLSGPGFSRRTKASLSNSERNSYASLSNSERNSYSKSRVPSESSATADFAVEQKPSSLSSYATETQVKLPSQTKSSFYQGSPEQGSPEEQAPKPNLLSKRSIHEESSSRRSYSNNNRQNHPSQSKSSDYWGSSEQHRSAEPSKPIPESNRSSSEKSLKSSAKEQPSNPPSRTVSSSGAESKKTSISHGEPPSRENSINKASHVHPKLPDYETFTAHLLSLRQNRQ